MHITDLVITDQEKVSLDDIFLETSNETAIRQLLNEHIFHDELKRYGLPVGNKHDANLPCLF
jgi:hypothetical protein